MDIQEVIKSRRSIRDFSTKPVPKDLIEKIIDCARFAATARNVQPWEFVVVTDKNILKQIANIAENGRFIADCSCCIVVLCEDTKYYLEDGCAATVSLMLAGYGLGIGSCWVAGDKKPYSQGILEFINAPKKFKLVSLVALGYPGSDPVLPEKRPLKELLHWEKF